MSTRGFSTIELMVVLAVVGILAALTVPNLPHWSAVMRLNAATRELASELQLARMKAIAQNTSFSVCFYNPSAAFPEYTSGFYSTHPNNTGWCARPPAVGAPDFTPFAQTVKKLPPGIQVTPPAGNVFTFNSRGQVNNGNFELTNAAARRTKRITVFFTGRVRIQNL